MIGGDYMLEDLINKYIEAMHKANLKDMIAIEKEINKTGMDSATLRVVVKETIAERKAS